MATLINKMVSWAAREAEELAAKSGIPIEKAAEEIADKYGQKVFSATTAAKASIEDFPTSPSRFIGTRSESENKSLRERIAPPVEESITAREASKYTEPTLLNRPVSGAGEKAMLGVQESTMAREASKYREPGVAGQKQLQNLQESTVARDASKYNEPDLPQYSREAGPEYRGIQRGFDPNAPMPPAGSLRAGLAAGAAGTAAIAGGMALRGAGGETFGADSDAKKEQWKTKKAAELNRMQIPFTDKDLERQWQATQESKAQSLQSQIRQGMASPQKREEELKSLRMAQEMAGIPASQLSTTLRKATPQELANEQLARSYATMQAEKESLAEGPKKEQPAPEKLTDAVRKTPAPAAAPSTSTPETPVDLSKLSNINISKQIGASLGTLDAKASDPNVPADERADLRKERDRAYEMFDQAKTRNEWLELAQLLGQAVTQYGAAQAGMGTGRMMAGLQIPSVDYGARTAGSERLLERRLRDIREGEQDIKEAKKQAYVEARDTKELELKQKEQKAKEDYQKGELGIRKQELGIKQQVANRPLAQTPEERQVEREQRAASAKAVNSARTMLQAINLFKTGNAKQRQEAMKLIDKNVGNVPLSAETQAKFSELQEGRPIIFGKESWDKAFEDAQSELKSIITTGPQAAAPARMQQEPAPAGGTVTVIHKATGQSRQFPAGSPEAERAKSDPEFEVR